jgi:hypothetical protein
MVPTRLSPAALLALLSACVLPVAGDGAFSVEGRLVPQSTAPIPSCELQLLHEAHGPAVLDARTITGQYRVTFVVAPTAQDYQVRMLCAGQVVQVLRVRYGSEVRPGGIVQLQELRL